MLRGRKKWAGSENRQQARGEGLRVQMGRPDKLEKKKSGQKKTGYN